MLAPVSETPQPKPQKVQTIGILMIISGILNVTASLGIVVGLLFSVVLICCIPFAALPLILGVFELIYGIRLIGSGTEPVRRQHLQVIAVIEVVTIMVSNVVSFVIGIVNLFLLNDPEVLAYIKD
jgi:putative flippase GtrA